MGMIRSRVNLTSAKFPLISRNQGQSIMVGQADLNFTPGLNPTDEGLIPQNDRGIPQIIYCDNVMPFQEGLQSVDNLSIVSDNVAYDVRKIFQVRDIAGNMAYFAINVTGAFQWQCLIYRDGGSGTVTRSLISGGAITGYIGGLITTAFINGETYIYFEGATDPCRKYNFSTNTLDVVTLTNFATNLVDPPKGIFASNGYLCGWSSSRVTWSSTVTPTDFVPSLATGAGVSQIQDAATDIMVCRSHARGGIIYTRTNTVGMVYTNNKNFPWNFRDIPGAGGCETEPLMTRIEDENEWHYAYTTYGLQKINPTSCRMFLPEVTEFLSGGIIESYDRNTNVFTYTFAGTPLTPLYKKLAMINSRYLCISYSTSQTAFEFCLVIDIVTQRWGKLRVPHVEIFEWQDMNSFLGRELPRRAIAAITAASGITNTSFVQSNTFPGEGVLILGRYQYIRQRLMQLQKITLQNARYSVGSNNMVIRDNLSIDGQTTVNSVFGTKITTDNNLQTMIYGFNSAVGLTHTFVISGKFALNSMLLEFNNHGRL